MNKPLSERYVHYDVSGVGKWQPVEPSESEETNAYRLKFESYLRGDYTIAPGDSVESSFEEETLAGTAAEFVERITGLPITCSMGVYTHLHDYNPDDMFFAVYDTNLHRIALRRLEDNASEYQRKLFVGSVLVHELVHSTMVDTVKVLDMQDGDSHDIMARMPHHMAEATPSFNRECFFEEGLAEELASRWREEFDIHLRERRRDLVSCLGWAAIPVRMYSPPQPIDQITNDNDRLHVYAAYCSFGIQLLSEYTDVDLVDLLIQARKPETQASASKKIKETVDSIEPGLYDVLTSADYTKQDFMDCLEIIKQAISNHAHEQHRIQI